MRTGAISRQPNKRELKKKNDVQDITDGNHVSRSDSSVWGYDLRVCEWIPSTRTMSANARMNPRVFETADITWTRVFTSSIGCVTQNVSPANIPQRKTPWEPARRRQRCCTTTVRTRDWLEDRGGRRTVIQDDRTKDWSQILFLFWPPMWKAIESSPQFENDPT